MKAQGSKRRAIALYSVLYKDMHCTSYYTTVVLRIYYLKGVLVSVPRSPCLFRSIGDGCGVCDESAVAWRPLSTGAIFFWASLTPFIFRGGRLKTFSGHCIDVKEC